MFTSRIYSGCEETIARENDIVIIRIIIYVILLYDVITISL